MKFLLRDSTIEDVPEIVKMIRELAEYEKLEDQCFITEEALTRAAFPTEKSPLIFVLIVEELSEVKKTIGMALYYYNYSTFTGQAGIYLEDLFVREAYRGHGVGTLIFEKLKQITLERDCTHLEWVVLDWNTSAREFYTKRVGAEELPIWIINRCQGEQLLAKSTK